MLGGIRLKIGLAFGAVLLLLAIVAMIGWSHTAASSAAVADIYNDELTHIVDLGATERAVYQLRAGGAGAQYATANAVQRSAILSTDTQRLALIDERMKRFADANPSPVEIVALHGWQDSYDSFKAARLKVIALVDQGRLDEATALRISDSSTAADASIGKLETLEGMQMDSANLKRLDALAAGDLATREIALVSALSLVLVVIVALFLMRNIASGLGRVASAAAGLAGGNLNQTIDTRSRDEIGQLARAFGDMILRLRTVIGEIQVGATGLSTASAEILAAVAQQSSGASEQSVAIVETTATVEQVKASADQAVQMAMVVSGNAHEASRVAGVGVQAAQDAAEGMVDLREKVESIAENILALSEQSQKIADIISTVNDLADQSNLLALNAAIEASRAGEQGKGFAVVAIEIRNLADQSKAATSQVRTILGDIQRATNATVLSTEQGTRGVDTGMRLVEQTGKTIGELAHVIDEASQSAYQIAASVRQHSVGMEQVAAAMVHINQATTHNLQSISDTRKAAENLTTLASGLTRAAAQYRV